jgi:hypothetical protein
MESPPPIYDSITSGALRMARRHWYVVVLCGLIGLLAGLTLASSSTWDGEATVRILFSSTSSPGEEPEENTSKVEPVSVAMRAQEQFEETELADRSSVDFTGDNTAGSVTVAVSADSESEAAEALDSTTSLANDIAVNELSSAVTARIGGLELLQAANQERLAAADERVAALQASGENPAPSDPALLERASAADALASTEAELALANSELDALSAGVVTTGTASVSPSESSPLVPLAIAILAAGLGFLALLLVQAFDGRIRRRIQIERSSPRLLVVGILPKKQKSGELSVLGRATSRFVADEAVDRLLVVPLKGRIDPDCIDAIKASVECGVETMDLTAARTEVGADGLGVLFVVPFGSVPQDVLQSAVAEAATAGTDSAAAMITDVPKADLAWASVSVY